MSIFGKSTGELRAERDDLEALISNRALELSGRKATTEETSSQLSPLTTQLVDLNNRILKRTSTNELRRELAELEQALDKLEAQDAAQDSEHLHPQASHRETKADRMRIEWKINRLHEHLSQRPPDVSMKNALIFCGVAAAFGIMLELVKRAA